MKYIERKVVEAYEIEKAVKILKDNSIKVLEVNYLK